MPDSPFEKEEPLTPILTPLEKAVMEQILDGEHPTLAILRVQVKQARIISREFSGVGFFTKFMMLETTPPVPSPKGGLAFGDVVAELKGLRHGAGFVLFLDKTGYLRQLEGYSYDEPWPKDTGIFKLKYLSPDRKELFAYLDEKR